MFNRKHDCPTHGHQLEPRYDSTLQKLSDDLMELFELIFLGDHKSFIEAINALKDTHYICDVCVKCGLQVNRPEEDKKNSPPSKE